ncbi:MAG TPA: CBS domain-containing protein [Actinomycetota bacterium]|nr:CBS domain-containing protein [Actinomycetota bacterium]
MAAGLPFEGDVANGPTAGSIARPDVPTCRVDEKLADVRARVEEAGWDACLAVNEERVVLGLLRTDDLAGGAGSTVEEAMRPGPGTFRPHVPIDEMAEHLVEQDLESVPVTHSDGTLVGMLRREDAVHAAHQQHAHHH